MAIVCPYCRHEIVIRDPKVGRFKIRCPECQGKSALSIDNGAEGQVVATITGLPSEPASSVETAAGSAGAGAVDVHLPGEPAASGPVPRRVGRLLVERVLGQGQLGSVYEGRDPFLGRRVALLVLRPELAKDGYFVARLTRDAYAAEQIAHPNIVRVLDSGRSGDLVYFVAEHVVGETLGQVVRKHGRVAPQGAAEWVLNAARGLKFAHDQNLAHRAIHPDSIVVDTHGLIKVANVGLTRQPGAQEASYGAGRSLAVRPPTDRDETASSFAPPINVAAYMAPERFSAPTRVDVRSDLYSLGCTLYALLTGRVPFPGPTVEDLKRQHAEDEVTPPDLVAPQVPQALSEIVLRLLAKRPEERYGTFDELIHALEAFLGVRRQEVFTPRAEDQQRFEAAVGQFQSGPMAQYRPWIPWAFHGVCLFLGSLFLITGELSSLFGIGMLWGTTWILSFVLRGILDRTDLFERFREYLLLMRPADWATLGVALLVVLTLTWVFQWTFALVLLLIVGGGFAAGLYFGVDRPLAQQRNASLDEAEGLVRHLRKSGVSEDDLRRFLCQHAGRNWEEFYENLFDYDAKRFARDLWGHGLDGRRRPRFASWRDPINDWLAAQIQQHKDLRDRARFAAIEEMGGIAEGMNLVTARRRARKAADAMILAAREIRESAAHARHDPEGIPVKPRPIHDAIRSAAEKPDEVLATQELEEKGPGILAHVRDALTGPRLRFLAGTILVGLCLYWAHQNAIFSAAEIKEKVEQAIKKQDLNVVGTVRIDESKQNTKPLDLPGVPASVLAWFNGWSPGAAGLILIASSLFEGASLFLFAFPAAAVAFVGPRLGIPALGPIGAPFSAAVVGAGILVVGILYQERAR